MFVSPSCTLVRALVSVSCFLVFVLCLLCAPALDPVRAVVSPPAGDGCTHPPDVTPFSFFSFSAGFITRNANVPPHIDDADEIGTIIAWASVGEASGGGFHLTNYLVRFKLHHDAIVFCRSCTLRHGSLPPNRGDGTRFGVALVCKGPTSTRARRQVAEVGLPWPKLL